MQRLDTQTRQKQIIDAALILIKQYGLTGLTIKNLAGQVNISEQAIYRHFENKLAILKALVLYFNQSLHEKLKARGKSDEILQDIEQIIVGHLEYFAAKPEMAALVYPEEVFQAEPLISTQVQETIEKRIDTITRIMKQAQQQGKVAANYSAENLALIIFGSIRIMITNWRFSGYSFDLVRKGKILANDLLDLIQAKN